MAAAVPGAEVTWSGQHAVVIAPALRVHLFCALADRPRLCGLAYARAVLGEFAAGRDGSGIFRAWGSGSQSLYERTLTGLLDPSAPAARPLELALVEAVETHVGQPLRHPENFHDRFFDDLAGLVAAARLACPEDPLTPAVVVGGPDCPACCGEEAMWRVVRSDRGHAAQAGMAGGLRSGGSVLGSEEAAEPALASWCPAHVTLVPSPSDLPLKWSLCRRDRVGDWGQPGRWHWLDRRGPRWSKMDEPYLGGPLPCAMPSCAAQARWAGPYEGEGLLNLCDACFQGLTGEIDTVYYRWVEAKGCWHRDFDDGPVTERWQQAGWLAVI